MSKINVNVTNQKIYLVSTMGGFVSGSQKFVQFHFNMDSGWDDLRVFAQFGQNGTFYNNYLDENNDTYLPPEIGPGTFTLMLYGSDEDVIATTNYLTISVDESMFVGDASSTEISETLYTQLVTKVNALERELQSQSDSRVSELTTRINTLDTWAHQKAADLESADRYLTGQVANKADMAALNSEVSRAISVEQSIMNTLSLKASQSEVDELTLKVTELENNEYVASLIENAVQSELAEYLESGQLANMTITDGSVSRDKVDADFEATLVKADTAMQKSVYDPQNLGVDVFSYAAAHADTVQHNLDNVTAEIRDAYSLTDTLKYTTLGDAVRGAVTLSRNYTQALLADYKAFTIVIMDELPNAGDPMTFYLVPNKSNSGYDKYWWITDNDGVSKWDAFGSSSTLVVTELPETGDEDVDYVLKSPSGCLYYKWIDGYWQVVAGSIASVSSTLPETGNEFTDYYILNDSGVYVHYRYINGAFHSIGTETYTSDELDALLASIRENVERNAQDIESINANITALSRTIERVSQDLASLDVEGYQYEATLSQSDGNYIFTLYEIKDDVSTVKSQFTLPSGGGSGPSSTTNLVVEKITPSPLIVTSTGSVVIEIDYSSTDNDGEEIDGTYTWKLGNTTILTGSLVQGRNSFDLTEFCSIGTQKFTLTVVDEGGSTNVKSWTVQVVDVRIESTFNDRNTFDVSRSVNFTYTPYGSVSKTIHFILDGVELDPVVTSASGTLQSYTLAPQTHGAHLLECYITATINNMSIETDHIFKDIIWFDSTSNVPVIGCIYRYDHYGKVAARQYNTTNIPYVVYDPSTSYPTVTLSIDGELNSTLRLTSATNSWSYKSDEVAEHVLTIACGETSVDIHMDIQELGYDISPVTANLEFDFNPTGISNSSENKLWKYSANPAIQLSVSDNFDWNNGGYQVDENGNQYFCVKSGTRAYFSYNLFGTDPKQNGSTFECIFKTENVRDNETTFLSCIPDEDTVKVGLQMQAHDAFIYSSTSTLQFSYSEEDIIEYEYIINPLDTENPDSTAYIMTYEDGVAARPMIFDDSHRLYQYTPVPITIGSDDCDVHIYRMKAYSAALSSSDVLKNFYADALDSETMIARYERNQIYDENNTLTPESVAAACPNLKVIKIDAPYFTNDKKNYVKYTNVECIHKNGDPALDNWKFTNGYHAGQGTTSNEYGFAGRNIDIIFGFDGQHQVTSKIPLEADYISELTLGDGTKYSDGSGKVALTRTSVPNTWFNIKVNIASSENTNNALLQKRYNDYIPYQTPGMRRNPFVKNSMEFYNCVIFIRENNTDLSTHREFADTQWHFYGIGNLGDSKKTDNTRVNDPTDMKEFVVEVSDNTLPNSWFQTGVYNTVNSDDEEELAKGEITFDPEIGKKVVYPITKEQWNDSRNLKRKSLYENWDDSFEFRYDMGTKDGETISDAELEAQQELSKQVFRDMYEWVITSTDEEFVSEFGNWFITESPLYWYLFTERYTMIDNRAKNSFWHWGKTYITETEAEEMGDDAKNYIIDNDAAAINNGYRFDLWDYDNDTALGINNSGELTMPYGKEDIDLKKDDDPNSGYIFNAAESVFWRRIRKLMHSQLQTLYLNRESAGCWSSASLIQEFDAWQEMFPEELWRLDIERKYIRTYEAGTTRFLNEMANGRKRYQRRQFERDMEAYIGTKYLGTTVTADQIMFRCNTPQSAVVSPDYTLSIVPYSDMYISVKYGNSPDVKQVRAKAGKPYVITTELTQMDDTAILIYCASRIQALNDLSACYIHDNDFSKASKLKTLIIGNTTEGYQNTFLTTLNMGNNTLLETLDIRNCPNLTGSINLSACANLIRLYAEGTIITSVLFANNGKIVTAHLPSTVNGLTLRNLNYLTDLIVAQDNGVDYPNLETFICEYSVVDALSIISSAISTLQTIRALGISWELAETTLLNNILKKNSSLLSGSVYVSGQIRNKELADYEYNWPDLDVTYNSANIVTQYEATFLNADGSPITRKDGVTPYTQYVDRGEAPYDPIEAGDVNTPTQESDDEYDYTFSHWDNISEEMLAPRTITAVYTKTVRVYRVTWYARAGLPLKTVYKEYGSEAVYDGDIPTNTTGESSYVYNLFTGWDKSTGFIRGDTDVYAVWATAELPATTKDLSDMSMAEIFAVASSGRAANYFEDKDYFDFNMGNDFNFSNVESQVLFTDKYFNGAEAIDTGIKLFGDNLKSFTLAIDFTWNSTDTDNTLVSCFEEDGSEGFRLRYNSGPNVQWGNRNIAVGNYSGTTHYRDIVVLRYNKNEKDKLYVYHTNNASSPTMFNPSVLVTELVRTRETNTNASLVFGAMKFLEDGYYDYYGKGTIHWCKIWYDDLGDANCQELAAWCHEPCRAHYYGAGRYRLADSSLRSNASFIFNNELAGRGYYMNPSPNTNAGGWDASYNRAFCNGRLFNGFPIALRSMIKTVRVSASAGSQSTEILVSQDKIYLAATKEANPNNTDTTYNSEVSAGISWFTSNLTRVKFRGRIIKEGAQYFSTNQEPSLTSTNNVKPGDIWINTGNESRGYMYVTQDEIDQFGLTPAYTANIGGGWVASAGWWLRSPGVSSSTSFWFVYTYGDMSTNGASNVFGVVPCFSI